MKSATKAIADLTSNASLPNGMTLISGSSGCGKTIFCQQYAYELLQDGGKVLWITTEELPATLRAGMKSFGWNTDRQESEGRLSIIDAVSPSRLGSSENVGLGMLGLDPTGMLIVISEQLKKAQSEGDSEKHLLVVDSVSRLLLSCEPRAVLDFVSCLNSRMENYNTRGFATVSEGAHDEKILNSLVFSTRGNIRFRIKETEDFRSRQFRIENLKGRKHEDSWKNYAITNSGLDIEV